MASQYMYPMYKVHIAGRMLQAYPAPQRDLISSGERTPCTRHLKTYHGCRMNSRAVYPITRCILCCPLGDVNGVLDVRGRACVGGFMSVYVETGRGAASVGIFKTLFG